MCAKGDGSWRAPRSELILVFCNLDVPSKSRNGRDHVVVYLGEKSLTLKLCQPVHATTKEVTDADE